MLHFKRLNRQSFKEKRFLFQVKIPKESSGGIWSGLEKGVGGLGSALEAAGELIGVAGDALKWLIKEGPKGLWQVFKEAKYFGADTLEDAFAAKKPPEYLVEYGKYQNVPRNSGEADKHYLKRKWTLRRAVLYLTVKRLEKEIAPMKAEHESLIDEIDGIAEGEISRRVLLSRSRTELKSLKARTRLADYPVGSPKYKAAKNDEAKILKNMKELHTEISYTNKPWVVVDPKTGDVVKDASGKAVRKKVNLKKRRDELGRQLQGPEYKIRRLKRYIAGIDHHYDPLGNKAKKRAKRRKKDKVKK